MNLLLLLSALLSALAGIGGARNAAAPSAVCECAVAVQATRGVAPHSAMRPIQPLPTLAAVRGSRGGASMLVAIEPLFANRRRE